MSLLMRVRPVFLVVLGLVVVAGVLTFTLRGNSQNKYERINAAQAAELKAWQAYLSAGRPYIPETIAALDGLRRERKLTPVATGCQVVRCYLVAQPPRVAALQLPGLMASVGADTRSVPTRAKGFTTCPGEGPLHDVCTYFAILKHNLIDVVVGPDIRCDPVPCRRAKDTEIRIDIPAASPPISP